MMAYRHWFLVVLEAFVLTNGLLIVVDGYKPCEGLDYNFDGYTYETVVDTDDKLWTHCSFPNPTADHTLCGRPEKTGHYYMCDPDTLIQDAGIANTIDNSLQDLQTSTSTLCVNRRGEKESFITSIAIIDKMFITDLQSPELCSNDCGKLLPKLNETSRLVTYNEKRELMTNFATHLRTTWALGSCGNDVIVLYCHEFAMVEVIAGSRASEVLSSGTVASLRDTFESYIAENGFEKGIKDAVLTMLAEIRKSLRGTTPGHIIMYIHISTMIVGGLILFLYVFVRDIHTDVWGGCSGWDVSDIVLQFLTGVWLVKGTLMVMAFMSHSRSQGLYWLLGVAILAFGMCLAMYAVSFYVMT